MKMNVSALYSLAVMVALIMVGSPATAQQQAFWPFARTPQIDTNPNHGDIQQFNGIFVERLARLVATPESLRCFQDLGTKPVKILTFESGVVVLTRASKPCAGTDGISPPYDRHGVIRVVSMSARRIFALALSYERFRHEPAFATNDRTMAHYDVETYAEHGNENIDFFPLPAKRLSTILGCPSTGVTSALYIVNVSNGEITLGHRVC